MIIKFNVPGKKRKGLALSIAEELGCEIKYLGAPTFSYKVGKFTIDRNGFLKSDGDINVDVTDELLEHLYYSGFDAEIEPTAEDKEIELIISMPSNQVALGNLNKIIKAKGSLIKKALGVSNLPINNDGEKVSFDWFPYTESEDELQAYKKFICKLCEFSRKAKRVTATEKEVNNEKYAFRCFLLRLGFIGDEYKKARKILLKNLSGSSAFKTTSKETQNELSK